jgi:diacylglycerol kinase
MITRFLKSVKYALDGIIYALKNERNFRIDVVAIIAVLRFSFFYKLTGAEKAIIFTHLFLVPAFELMNTAIERAVDLPDKDHYDAAGRAKDAAAGGVLLLAISSIVTAAIMFGNIKTLSYVLSYYFKDLFNFIKLVVFVTLSYLFITLDKFTKTDSKGNFKNGK